MPMPPADRLRDFPWPFTSGAYRYSANVEPAPTVRQTAVGEWGARVLHVDGDYAEELAERRAILARDPLRHVELDHMRPATWDALLWCLRELAQHEEGMTLSNEGDVFLWANDRLDVRQTFRFGDDASLPLPPLAFLGSQVQEDIVLLDQREDRLWVDAGLVTFASNWSLAFDAGMSFQEIHGPVPHDLADGAIPRAEQFLLRLGPDAPFRRVNWTSTAGHRLDTAMDSYANWGASRAAMATCGDLPETFHMRVEVQHLTRLPHTGAILFLIRTYLLPLAQIIEVPRWRAEFAGVLETLSPDILQYKGLSALKPRLLEQLRPAPAEPRPPQAPAP